MMATLTPSKYQEAIYEFVANNLQATTRRNLIISAVAGSGKSTTIKELLRFIPSYMTVLYLTFMREVNADLGDKVTAMLVELRGTGAAPEAEVRTCHSIGNGCLRSIGIKGDPGKNGRKYNHLVQEFLKANMRDYDYKVAEKTADLVNKVRVTLSGTDEDSLLSLIRRYAIDIDTSDKDVWSAVRKCVPYVLEAGVKLAKEKIDFTDQIWLASSQAMNLTPNKYDIVMVDEAQDLSPAIRELSLKAVKNNGMVICVGDRRQAIMAFAGASSRSLDELKEALNAVELPLNKCYRCPKAVIRLAQTLVPEIESYEGADEGAVEYIIQSSVASMAQIGDMILSRYNAPLVEMAIDLIKMRKRCIVKGRDLGGNVIDFLKKVTKFFQDKSFTFSPEMLFSDIVKFVGDYHSRMLAVLMTNEEENEGRISKLEDDCATLLALYEGYAEDNEHGDYNGFVSYIENFFAEHGETNGEIKANARKYTITLSTGHKAKGLENPNVFILGYDELPTKKAKTAEAIEQEMNLLYVMITRAQNTLYCVVKSPSMFDIEQEGTETDELDTASIMEEVQDILSLDETPIVEAVQEQETASTSSEVEIPASTGKRTYGGRKALSSEDKRVFFQQTWDTSVRSAFRGFVETLNTNNGTNFSEADALEAIVLSNPAFAAYFQTTEHASAYADRKEREKARQAYKNRKRDKKAGE